MLEVTVGSDLIRGHVSSTLWIYKMSYGTGNVIIYILKIQRSSAVVQIWLRRWTYSSANLKVHGCRPCAVRYSVFLRNSRSCM